MVSFGVISDIQYADHEDALAKFPPIRMRYYRRGVEHLKLALDEFKRDGAEFMLQLGDLIDGKNKAESPQALKTLLDVLKDGELPVYHAIGNHDLYNFSHAQAVNNLMNSNGSSALVDKGYYAFTSHGLRLICIDCYDVAMLGRSSTDPEHSLGKEHLAINPNSDPNSPTGLEGDNRRFLLYNGGLGNDQMVWLENELKQAESANQSVILFGKCKNIIT